jgi:hypothetical protein
LQKADDEIAFALILSSDFGEITDTGPPTQNETSRLA